MNDNESNTLADEIKRVLSDHLGIEPTDISEEDTFMEDLHMKPTEFADFLEELNEEGFDTTDLDLSSISSVADLLESLSSHVYTE